MALLQFGENPTGGKIEALIEQADIDGESSVESDLEAELKPKSSCVLSLSPNFPLKSRCVPPYASLSYRKG